MCAEDAKYNKEEVEEENQGKCTQRTAMCSCKPMKWIKERNTRKRINDFGYFLLWIKTTIADVKSRWRRRRLVRLVTEPIEKCNEL